MDRRMTPAAYMQQKSLAEPSSPVLSHRHARSGSTGVSNVRKAQTKAAAQRLAAVMAHQPSDNENDSDDDGENYSHDSIGIGLAGTGGRARPSRSRSPMIGPGLQRRIQVMNQPAEEDDGEAYDFELVTSASIGLGGGRAMRTRSPLLERAHFSMPQRHRQESTNEDNNENNNYGRVSGAASGGLAAISKVQTKSTLQRHKQVMEDDNSDDDNSSISAFSRRGLLSPTPKSKNSKQEAANEDYDEDNAYSRLSSKGSIGVAGGKSMKSPTPMRSPTPLRSPIPMATSIRTNQEEYAAAQPSQARAVEQSSQPINSVEEPLTVHSTMAPQSFQSMNAIAQPPSKVKTVPSSTNGVPGDNRSSERYSEDFGSTNLKEAFPEQSASAEDEVDILQGQNETLLQKASLKAAVQTPGGNTNGGGVATDAWEPLRDAEDEIRSLRAMIQRLTLTQEEMEEVVLKRCWLAHYWNLCVQHGILVDIACEKYEYWSSFAPLPVEVVMAAGQRAKEEKSLETNNAEEREKVPQDLKEQSAEGNIESMLLVEKGLQELAILKAEDAVALAMALHRRPNHLKLDEVKLPTEGQFEAFELSQEESEDTRFKQAWLLYFWRRAKNNGVEPDIADDRLQFWIEHSNCYSSSHDAVDVQKGLMELRKLGIESQLWLASRKGLEQDLKSGEGSEF